VRVGGCEEGGGGRGVEESDAGSEVRLWGVGYAGEGGVRSGGRGVGLVGRGRGAGGVGVGEGVAGELVPETEDFLLLGAGGVWS
jgi:hypothetical protein